MQPLKNLTSQGTALEFRNILGPFAKKIENLLFSEITVIGQSPCKCPGSSSRTIKVLPSLMTENQQ